MKCLHHLVPNKAGWHLSLHQTWDEKRLVPGRRPVLIVPGYGMNSFIFSFHPNGHSLEGYLVNAGFEVWRVDLRGQGESTHISGSGNYTIEDLACVDLGVAVDEALARTRTGTDRADMIGCSLGGTLMFTHAVLNPAHRLGTMVSMGSPLRWTGVHPAIRLAFSWPMLVGLVRIKGARKLAEVALPKLVRHAPWMLSFYLNPEVTDTAAAKEMVRTVEDPNRYINRELARWIRDQDLIVRGTNISDAMARVKNPYLCVLANGDGVVPPETARSAFIQAGSAEKRLLEVGSRDRSLAHADLFVSNEVQDLVFAPISEWLTSH